MSICWLLLCWSVAHGLVLCWSVGTVIDRQHHLTAIMLPLVRAVFQATDPNRLSASSWMAVVGRQPVLWHQKGSNLSMLRLDMHAWAS